MSTLVIPVTETAYHNLQLSSSVNIVPNTTAPFQAIITIRTRVPITVNGIQLDPGSYIMAMRNDDIRIYQSFEYGSSIGETGNRTFVYTCPIMNVFDIITAVIPPNFAVRTERNPYNYSIADPLAPGSQIVGIRVTNPGVYIGNITEGFLDPADLGDSPRGRNILGIVYDIPGRVANSIQTRLIVPNRLVDECTRVIDN